MFPQINDIKESPFYLLVEQSEIDAEDLKAVLDAARIRKIEPETILLKEYGVSKSSLLQALASHYDCPFLEYDERMPIPPDLLYGLDGKSLSRNRWFPIIKDGEKVVVAAHNPSDQTVRDEVKKSIPAKKYEFWVALNQDIQWFIQDFLHTKVGELIGTERTGLAFCRNTMAQWRTKMACFRTDLAKARTGLAFARWGLGLVGVANTLIRSHETIRLIILYYFMVISGLSLISLALYYYLKIRKSRMTPPKDRTLVEVTAATVQFLENYLFIEGVPTPPRKNTMLARLGDFLAPYCTILYPSPASRERTHLARERNVLAAQRTVAGCYRTIYARARTGLSFIRSGVSFLSFGLGLIYYFGFSLLTTVDAVFVISGLFMIMDGILWYQPVRDEKSGVPRYPPMFQ